MAAGQDPNLAALIDSTIAGDPFDGQCQLPGQVVSVLQAGVHAQASDGWMNVCGVTGQKYLPDTVCRCDPVAHTVNRRPA